MKHILLPTDFSENSWKAIQYGLMVFQNTVCTFYLFTVNPIPSYTGAQSSVRTKQEKLRKNMLEESQEDLQKLLKRIETLGPSPKHKFVTIAVYDYFIDAVKKVVAQNRIDLIVMGTKGASGLKKIVMGSNTAALITKIDCPLLAVPEDAPSDTPREMVLATDFKVEYNEGMLATLREMAALFKAVVRVLHVIKKEGSLSAEQTENRALLKKYLKDMEHSFHTLTSTEVETAVQNFVAEKNIDMIVMVAKNKRLFQRILLKPTVEKVSYHLEVPFLVLHE
ncbi:MAG: universal stress protein [Flavobacteriaceae bacterium]